MARSSQEATESYIHSVLGGDTDRVLALFAAEPSIHDPMAGSAIGRIAVSDLVTNRHNWLATYQVRVEHLRTTQDAERTVAEFLLHLVLDGEPYPLPYAVVGEHASGKHLQQIRVYHSMWPLIGAHEIRGAILPEREDLELKDVIAKYQKALAEGDVAAIVETFEPDGYFREPAGGPHFHRGKAQVAEFMTMILAPGGIPLEHCTVTDDGVACAIEFNAVAFGPHVLVPQAGVAVYERGTSGLLHAARIYDDVNVEALAA
jgi:hypothetical protein